MISTKYAQSHLIQADQLPNMNRQQRLRIKPIFGSLHLPPNPSTISSANCIRFKSAIILLKRPLPLLRSVLFSSSNFSNALEDNIEYRSLSWIARSIFTKWNKSLGVSPSDAALRSSAPALESRLPSGRPDVSDGPVSVENVVDWFVGAGPRSPLSMACTGLSVVRLRREGALQLRQLLNNEQRLGSSDPPGGEGPQVLVTGRSVG